MSSLKSKISQLDPAQRETLKALASRRGASRAAAPVRLGQRESALSLPQRRLWLMSQLDVDANAYNIPGVFQLRGALDEAALRQALEVVGARHEILHSRFQPGDDGEPCQRVDALATLSYRSEAAAQADEAFVQAWAGHVVTQPLDLAGGVTWRAALLCCGGDLHVLALSFHHIVFDGWSLGVFARELFQTYGSLVQGGLALMPPPALQYTDYVAWQQRTFDASARARETTFWRGALSAPPAPLDLPADRPGPQTKSFRGGMVKRLLPQTLFERVRKLATQEGTTPYAAFLAAFKLLLMRHTQATDLVVGTPVSGRSIEEIEPMVGVFVNTLPVRTRLAPDEGYRQLLRQVREASLDAFSHATLPFDEIVEAVRPERLPGVHPLFQTLYTYQNAIPGMQAGALSVSYLDIDTRTAKFDLSLDVFEGVDGPTCLFEYDADLFDAARIERMADHYAQLLASAVESPDLPIGRLAMLCDDELDLVCASVIEPRCATPVPDWLGLVEQHAARQPQATAIRFEGQSTSYSELNAQANRIAHRLRRQGVKPGDIVGLCLERTPTLFAAVLGTLKAGAAFVALDPVHPAQRLASIATDAGVRCVLSAQTFSDRTATMASAVLHLDAAHDALPADDTNPGLAIPADAVAYVVYTSGTTGQPKGVQVTHRNIGNAYLGWHACYQLDHLAAHLQMASFPFDVFCGDLIRALGSGKTLVVCPHALFAEPDRLHALIERERVDFAEFVPAVFRGLAEHLFATGKTLPTLVRLIVASDSWYVSEYRAYRALLGPQGHLINSYGMAEATIDSTWFESDADTLAALPDGQLVPIGRPFPNVEMMVLDPQMQPVPVGVVGELCVGGDGVAAGYLNRPALNAEKFVPHPFATGKSQVIYRTGDMGRWREDGQLELLGRRDTQVKLRGMRIELGEVEMALRDAVAALCRTAPEVAAVVRDDLSGGPALIAYLAIDACVAEAVEPAALNAALADRLPGYMVPSAYVFLAALPLSSNGKVDRQRLPRPDQDAAQQRGFVSPRTLTEEMLATIWCHTFRLNRVGVYDSFFALGGHSLLAFQIIAQAREAFQIDLALSSLFANPTIAGLAGVISEMQGRREAYDATVNALPRIQPDPSRRHEPFPLTEVQQAYWLGRNEVFEFGNVTTHSYDEMETRAIDVARFQRAWNQVVARHDMLRAEILPDGTQRILAQVPEYTVRELDLRGLDEAEVETAIEGVRAEMSHQMLDVHRWPVFDVRVTRITDERARIHFSSDALIFDVWSFVIIIEDLVKFYLDQDVQLPPLELCFRDYVIAEESLRHTERYARALAYWRGRIEALAPAPDLPMAMDPAQLKKPHFTRLHAELDPEAWGRLKRKAVRAGMTATGVMLAAYAEVLAAYSGNPAFSLNLTFLNRHPMHPQVNDIVGEFTSLTMLGVDQRQGRSFIERARRVQADLWNDLEHHDISGVQVLRDLTRTQGGATRAKMPVVFTSALVVPIPKRRQDFPVVPVYRDGVTQTSQVWLDCGVWEDDHVLLCNWDVVLELYPQGLIEEMFAAYWQLVTRLANDDAAWHGEDLYVAPAPQATHADHGLPLLPLGDETLDSLFLRSLARHPNAPAVITESVQLSYSALGEHVSWLAGELVGQVAKGELVAVAMDKGWEQVVAVLGVVVSGAAYLPIDPSLPDERITALLNDGRVRCLITTPALRGRFSGFVQAADRPTPLRRVVAVDDHGRAPTEALYGLAGPTPDDVAYVIFTSGSTGRPKGVTINHRGAVNTVLDVNDRYDLGPADRVLAVSSLSFDLSVFDIFGMLAAGGAVVIPTHERRLDPTHWLALMQANEVTVWNSVPALCALLLDHAEQAGQSLPALRRAMLSGDWIPVALPDRIRACCPDARVASLGGATEASIWSVAYEIGQVAEHWKSVPYGTALRNQSIRVLNDRLEPCPDWVSGHLYIGGAGLALGYWGDAERTAASFVQHPVTGERLYRTGDLGRRQPDGNIEFLGRTDAQVKVQGYRIELGEIEAVLTRHPAVAQAVALAVGQRHSEKRLAALVVPRQGEQADAGALREWLAQSLPEYMVPQVLQRVEALPLSANGKVDRAAAAPLVAPLFEARLSREQAPTVAPRNDMEARVAAVWCRVLGLPSLGVLDDFFQLGGDSMLAIKLLASLRHELGLDLRLKDIFLCTTVASQAERADALNTSKV